MKLLQIFQTFAVFDNDFGSVSLFEDTEDDKSILLAHFDVGEYQAKFDADAPVTFLDHGKFSVVPLDGEAEDAITFVAFVRVNWGDVV